MLGTDDVHPTIGVKDLETAKQFYSGTLGLELLNENHYELVYRSGNGMLQVYKSGFAGTNKATYASWKVDDVENVVMQLEDKGVTFEQYDEMEGGTRQGNIHILGDRKAAWFKDLDGNILCVSNG